MLCDPSAVGAATTQQTQGEHNRTQETQGTHRDVSRQYNQGNTWGAEGEHKERQGDKEERNGNISGAHGGTLAPLEEHKTTTKWTT